MDGTLSASERAKYEGVWSVSGYEDYSPGEHYAQTFTDYMRGITPVEKWYDQRVLDAGCGAGKAGDALEALSWHATSLDITKPPQHAKKRKFIETSLWSRWSKGQKFDWIYSCDVMEHLPPEMVGLVLDRFRSASPNAWLAIALVPDNKVLTGDLHLTVRPFVWWRNFLANFGTVVDARDLWHTGLFHVRF